VDLVQHRFPVLNRALLLMLLIEVGKYSVAVVMSSVTISK
jgi:hypothetical protein